jgi:hypothetical protein
MTEGKSWNRRMAEYVTHQAQTDAEALTVEGVESILEAAGELKAVRCKMLLGRCYELMSISVADGGAARPDDGFLEAVLAELAR